MMEPLFCCLSAFLDTELWCTNTLVPRWRICSVILSVKARLWQKNRLFWPRARLLALRAIAPRVSRR